MRTRAPLRVVQATAAAGTARFRLWTEPAGHEDEGALDFKACAAAFVGTGRANGRTLQTISLPDASFVREPRHGGWMRVHSTRWRQGSWDPFGVLDVVAALPELVAHEPEPTQRGALQLHLGRLDGAAAACLAGDESAVMRRVRPAADASGAEVAVWIDSRLRIGRVRYRTAAAQLHFALHDFARPVAIAVPERFESVDLDALRGALRSGA